MGKANKKPDIKRVMNSWLSKYEIEQKDFAIEEERKRSVGARESKDTLKKKKPQATLDLHGKTLNEAEPAVNAFLRESFSRGLSKVLIIHGKGHHSGGEPVLKKLVYDALRRCSFAGETGIPERAEGGSGAVWVILRQRSR
ncbi:MAG: DNA mismatch repair protein MutS [Spirochaetales bacterium]|nr:MAG: DNA mismatch repair protein MutS [Spirochaetales bacterium]